MSKSFATSACFYFEAVSGNMSQHKRIGFRRPGSRKPLNKTMLLPLPNISVQKISLPVHLALAACRGVAGNAHLMSELVRVVYLSYFLAETEKSHPSPALHLRAEAFLESAIARAKSEQVWQLSEDGAGALEEVIALYDRQLSTVPTWVFLDASDRLDRFTLSNRHSPLPNSEAKPL